MRLTSVKIAVLAIVTAASVGCSSPTAAPSESFHSDVDAAHTAWLANRPQYYQFELTFGGFYYGGHYDVFVADGNIVVSDEQSGTAIPGGVPSIDMIWDRLLSERADGLLHSATFNELGIPVDSNMGAWDFDAGTFYSIRNFKVLSRPPTTKSWG